MHTNITNNNNKEQAVDINNDDLLLNKAGPANICITTRNFSAPPLL